MDSNIKELNDWDISRGLSYLCGPHEEYRRCRIEIDVFCSDNVRRCYCQRGYVKSSKTKNCVIDDGLSKYDMDMD